LYCITPKNLVANFRTLYKYNIRYTDSVHVQCDVVPYNYYQGILPATYYDMSDGPLFIKYKHKDEQINYTSNTSDFHV